MAEVLEDARHCRPDPVRVEDSMAPPYRIVLADDHSLFRDGVKRIIKNSRGLEVTGEAGDGLELLDFLQSSRTAPDLIVLDITMPKIQGLDVAREIKQRYPGVKVLFLTMHKSKEHFLRAISLGAEGYLLKEDTHQDLIAAIKTIREGGTYISPLMAENLEDLVATKVNSIKSGRA
jgi:DNA-binding NarL/FixJ family response regulator